MNRLHRRPHTILLILLAMISKFAGLTTHAVAGDFAKREIIGFSEYGYYFAFEETGVQDGSGFPYASIYILDTVNDRWADNSPYHAVLESEDATVEEARAKARSMAGTVLGQIKESGFIAATNRHSEISADHNRMIATPVNWHYSGKSPIDVQLNVYRVEGEDYCGDNGMVAAFTLTRLYDDGRPTEILHDDGQSIPDSRFCALDYQLADMVIHWTPKQELVGVILVRVWSMGFEGPNGRYIAIPFRGE